MLALKTENDTIPIRLLISWLELKLTWLFHLLPTKSNSFFLSVPEHLTASFPEEQQLRVKQPTQWKCKIVCCGFLIFRCYSINSGKPYIAKSTPGNPTQPTRGCPERSPRWHWQGEKGKEAICSHFELSLPHSSKLTWANISEVLK